MPGRLVTVATTIQARISRIDDAAIHVDRMAGKTVKSPALQSLPRIDS
jgi:hypothetical protein